MGLCVEKEAGESRLVPFRGTGGQVRVLICALDYAYSPGHELTSSFDGALMVRMAKHADCTDITAVTDHHKFGEPSFPVRSLVLDRIKEVASRCKPGDWFVWFWAGHGVNVPDTASTEADGLCEAFVTPDKEGRLTQAAVLVDEDFAKALDASVPLGVKILCICDCCHSGTICDIDTFSYRHDIYQISASLDHQEAEDTGRGGVLTWALKRTLIKQGFRNGKQEFSVLKVFKGCKKRVARITTEQEVSVQYSGPPPETVAWPLCFPIWRWPQKVPADLQDHELK